MVVKCKSYDIAPSTDIDLGLHICNCGNRDALFGGEFDIAVLSFRAANTHEVTEPDVLKGLLLKRYTNPLSLVVLGPSAVSIGV